MRTSYLCITIKKQEASISIVQLLLTKKRNMKNLVLEEFDLHEFNKWMLDIQKLEQKINCVLNIFGVWHIEVTKRV